MQKPEDTKTKRGRGRPPKDTLIPSAGSFRDLLATVGVQVAKPPAELAALPEYLAQLLAGSLEVLISSPALAPMAAIREIRSVSAQIERMSNLAEKDRQIATLQRQLAQERARNGGRPGVPVSAAVAMPDDGVRPAALRGRPPKGGGLA